MTVDISYNKHFYVGIVLSVDIVTDIPIYIYDLSSRFNLSCLIEEYFRKEDRLKKETIEELCWKIDCLRESSKFTNNLGKEKKYISICFRTKLRNKFIPFWYILKVSSISIIDHNCRTNWLKYFYGDKRNKETSLEEQNRRLNNTFFETLPTDKILIDKVISKILNDRSLIKNKYDYIKYINLYYTYCYGGRNT